MVRRRRRRVRVGIGLARGRAGGRDPWGRMAPAGVPLWACTGPREIAAGARGPRWDHTHSAGPERGPERATARAAGAQRGRGRVPARIHARASVWGTPPCRGGVVRVYEGRRGEFEKYAP